MPDPTREQELLANLGWVERLARALVADASTAADVAQTAVLAWYRDAPAWAARGGGLRAWFGRALRSFAIDHRRSEQARHRREQVVAAQHDDTTPATADLVLRLEQQQRITQALHQLAEPYRTTLLQRFLEDRSTEQVAALQGVPAATVRKRLERGLRQLRSDLGLDHPPRSGQHHHHAPAAAIFGGTSQGPLLMAMKLPILGLSAAAAAAAFVFWWWSNETDAPGHAVGGHGTVVALGTPPSAPAGSDAAAAEAAREAATGTADTSPATATHPITIHGRVFVDGQLHLPAALEIAASGDTPGAPSSSAHATIAPDTSSWTMVAPRDWATAELWITSNSTAPAHVPLPTALLASGGQFDLHLNHGQTLVLTFVEPNGQRLANLPFALQYSIETGRQAMRSYHRGQTRRLTADARGEAEIQGVPLQGWVEVVVDLTERRRLLKMLGGQTIPVTWSADPVWRKAFAATTSQRVEVTIPVPMPAGEAFASGTVPGWARAADGSCTGLAVVARERRRHGTDARGLSDAFVLPLDDQGNFSLAATAPCRHLVWIERTNDGSAVSATAEVEFGTAGPQAPVVFVPLDVRTFHLHCEPVPSEGVLEVTLSASGTRRAVPCRGAAIDLELPMTPEDQALVRVHRDGEHKSGWQCQLPSATLAAGSTRLALPTLWRQVAWPSGQEFPSAGAAALLLPCAGNRVVTDRSSVFVFASAERSAAAPVEAGQHVLVLATGRNWCAGVVSVAAGGAGAADLVVPMDLERVAAAELEGGYRLDGVDGVDLTGLPEGARTVQPQAGEEWCWLPRGRVGERVRR